MKTLKIMSATATTPAQGPDEVHVVCDGHQFQTVVPRGLGEAYAKALGESLTFARVQLTERPDGSVSMQLDTRRGDGTHVGPVAVDFDEDFADSAEARGYARALRFTEATVIKMRQAKRPGRDGKPRFAMIAAVETL